jgi:hypothetical protein
MKMFDASVDTSRSVFQDPAARQSSDRRRVEQGGAMTGDLGRAGARMALLCALLASVLSGCAVARSTQETVGGWFGGKPTDGPAAGVRPRAYYAASARVKVLAEPAASASVVGELALHEGVLGYQVEEGYAYVTSQTGDTKGWVSVRALIEKLPSPTRAAKPAAAPPAATPAQDGATAEPLEPLAPEDDPSDDAEKPSPGATPEKSIFDPY